MRLIEVDALIERLSDFLARNYEPLYDLDDISELKWPIEHEQQKAAWIKVLRRVMDAMPTVYAIPVDWLERRLDETAEATAQGNDQTELNNAIFQVLVEWEKERRENGKAGH